MTGKCVDGASVFAQADSARKERANRKRDSDRILEIRVYGWGNDAIRRGLYLQLDALHEQMNSVRPFDI
jgi:hypothetical protein